MSKFQMFLSGKSKGYFVYFASLIFTLIAVIALGARGGDILTEFDPLIVWLPLIGMLVGSVALYKDFPVLENVPFVLDLVGLSVFLNEEFTFIGNVFVGVDGNHFDAAFFIGLGALVLAFIVGFIAAIMGLEKEETEPRMASEVR